MLKYILVLALFLIISCGVKAPPIAFTSDPEENKILPSPVPSSIVETDNMAKPSPTPKPIKKKNAR